MITPKATIRVYRLRDNEEIMLFTNAVIVDNILGVFEIVEEIKNRTRV